MTSRLLLVAAAAAGSGALVRSDLEAEEVGIQLYHAPGPITVKSTCRVKSVLL